MAVGAAQTYTVPTGCTSIVGHVWGASGGGGGGSSYIGGGGYTILGGAMVSGSGRNPGGQTDAVYQAGVGVGPAGTSESPVVYDFSKRSIWKQQILSSNTNSRAPL